MSIYTVLWILWAVTFCVIEGVALFNRRRGDTLSEHVWAWLGVRDDYWHVHRSNPAFVGKEGPPVTPKWTLKVARLLIASATLWLGVHFLTGGRFW